MIPEIKKLLKERLPKTLFKAIYKIYGHSLFYIVRGLRSLYIQCFFRNPQLITIRNTNLKIKIDPKNGYTDKNLFYFKERDTDLTKLMEAHLKPGDTMIDIGANVGYETIWGASLVGENGHVYSFEPLKELVEQIRISLETNSFKNVTLINKAVGENSGYATIYRHPKDAGLSSIENKEGASGSVSVSVVTVDEEIPMDTPVSFIKIDIEGYEFEAFKGAVHLLRKDRPLIVFEFTPHLYEKSYLGKSKALLLFLMEMGYAISIMGNDQVIKKDDLDFLISSLLKNEESMVNMIARPHNF